MTPRKKGRKNNKGKYKTDDTDKVTKYNPYAFFNAEELSQIKSTLKIKEVLSIPIAIGCVILNNFETLDKAVHSGLDINELGPNNTTALIWAVRYKYIELIAFLLKNGADPNIKVDNGESIIIIALEHKLWDEISFIHFWSLVQNISAIDVNATNKNGHTILHIAVRREWEKFIEKLLTEKVNIDITNINGVTPLMTACFRNNIHIVNILLNNGADYTKEDNHYRTALCYGIVTSAKMSKPPFLIAERIIFELKKDLSFKEYIKAIKKLKVDFLDCLIDQKSAWHKKKSHFLKDDNAPLGIRLTASKHHEPPLGTILNTMRRIQIINLIINKDKISDAESEMLVTLTQYIVQYTENGLKVILDFKIFELLQKTLKKIQNDEKQKLLLLIIQELLCYNEQVIGFTTETQIQLTNQFLNSNIIYTCLDMVKNKDKHFNWAFHVILTFCTLNEPGQNWLKENYEQFKQPFKILSSDAMHNFQKDFPDEKRQKLMKKKMKKLRRSINIIEGESEDIAKPIEDVKSPVEKKSEHLFSIKKSKRRSKVIKAKITKIKNMELTERLSLRNNVELSNKTSNVQNQLKEFSPESNSLTSRIKLFNVKKEEIKVDEGLKNKLFQDDVTTTFGNSQERTAEQQFFAERDNSTHLFDVQLAKEIQENEQIVNTFMSDELYCPYYCYDEMGTQNTITDSLKQFLQSQQEVHEKEEPCFFPTFPEWKSKIYKLPFNDWSTFSEKMKTDKRKLKAAIQYMKKISMNHDNTANAINLDAALNIAIEYLKELLEIILTRSKNNWELRSEVKASRNGKKSNHLEKQTISELQANFHHLISSICSLAHSNLPEAIKNIYHLESTLLNFPVRGKTLLSDVCALENVKIQYTTYSYEAESSFLTYVENILNGFEELREDIKITVVDGNSNVLENEQPGLFEKEMSLLSPPKSRNKRKEIEAKIKTMENAYHLIDDIEKLVEDDDEMPSNSTFMKPEVRKNSKSSTQYSDIVLKILTRHVEGDSSKGAEKSRWADKIQHLQAMKHSQSLLGGDVKLGRFPERNHIISQGGNFNLVTLGLSLNDQALAVKKIPREHCVCKVLKSLINPLIGLRNKHILHYFVCDYEENDLILATPLCEYNIGQYVLLLKENANKNIFNLNQMEIVKQFLNGLAFLHQRIEPIVHGNLKPSNIFVDINGVVRLAEFGIYKALFKLIEAPKSSLIWFSQETYRMYKITSVMECSICSDIQVAGMIIYFIVSGGVHPFGPDVTSILKNLEKAAFSLPPTTDAKNQIFADLVSWMLMYEPNDRPNIKQILSHVLFWSNERRWRFILNCAGISTNGVPLSTNTEDLHEAIAKMSTQEQIKGHWVSIARRKFPDAKVEEDDTVVGLLKFISQFYENLVVSDESITELKNCVLTYFPAFPLTLYRILEATGIIKDYPFISYTMAENLVS